MEIENQIKGIFKKISEIHLNDIWYGDIICQLQISLQKQSDHTHKIFLTKNNIFLTEIVGNEFDINPNSNVFVAALCFELKFEMQFQEQNNPQSNKIGISLYYQNQQNITFYSANQYSLKNMRNNLNRYLNQKGFHTQFKPIKKLGKGNFATVYQVSRVEDHKKFAVKAFSKANTFGTENGKQALINQLSIMRLLSYRCKHILCLESVYQSDNSIYVVLQLLEGKNLFDVLRQKNHQFTLSDVRAIMEGLLQGLKCMKQSNIMHRDLKPQNIMFRSSSTHGKQKYEAVIVDFGLATNAEHVPYLFFRCGTPGFVAPEIIKTQQNQKYEPACDMFSIGCIFHLLITNQAIFQGTKYEEVYRKNKLLEMSINYEILNSFNPFALDLLQKMLNENPLNRINPLDALSNQFFGELRYVKGEKQEQSPINYPIIIENRNKRTIGVSNS